jgi:hypothetical protein
LHVAGGIEIEPKDSRPWRRKLLPKLALGILAVLLLAPSTRWLFLYQLRTEFLPSLSRDDRQHSHETALKHPNEYFFQLADALNPMDQPGRNVSLTKRERLQTLVTRFPDRPSAYANLMRGMSMREVNLRFDDSCLRGEPPVLKTASLPSAPEALAIFKSAAAEGERLDPSNAYFPLMRCVGLFAGNRNEEAMEAMHRASLLARWDDFTEDELVAERRCSEEALGHRPILQRVCQNVCVWFPHCALIRAAAHMAVFKAIQEELRGRFEVGIAIRIDLLRIGSLLRSKSQSAIGCNLGIAITGTALTRPGGAPVDKKARLGDYMAAPNDMCLYLSERAETCAAYFQRIGHADEADRLLAEIAAASQAKEIIANGFPRSPYYYYFDSSGMIFVPTGSLISVLPLANIVTLLAMGCLAALLLRMRSHGVGFWWRLVLFVGIVGLIGAWHVHVVEAVLSSWMLALRNLGVKELPELVANPIWFTLGCFVVPVLMLGGLAVVALFSRVPVHLAFARGMRHLAVPTACVLLLGYGGLTIAISYQEYRLNAEMDRMSQHEGKYFAGLVGRQWPGPVK